MHEYLVTRGFVPRVGVWELTLACNLNCRHCGSRAGRGRGDELTTDEALALCRELVDLGMERMTFSGGEPLLREDWPELARVLVAGGVHVNMISNGQKFTRDTVKIAQEVGLAGMAFSLDGLEGSHTYLRRLPGNWEKIWDNLRLCQEAGLCTSVITTVYQRNVGELSELRRLLGEAGVAIWQLQLATPSGNMADHDSVMLSPDQILALLPAIVEMRRSPDPPEIHVGDNLGYYGGLEQGLRGPMGPEPDDPDADPVVWLGCNAGCSVVGIESNGNIKGCLSLPSARNEVDVFVEDNLRKRPLREIWNDPEAFAYNRKFDPARLEGFCRTCDYAEFCRGGCTWSAFANTGSRYESRYCYHRLLEEKQQREAQIAAAGS